VHIAAAEWILRLPEGRGQELLDAGCKAVLLILWNHARWTEQRNATCEECYPSAATVADHTGSSLKATRKRLARLAAAGWIRHERRANREWGFALAWRVPFALPLEGHTPGGETALPLQGPSTTPPGSKHCPSRGTKLSTNEAIEQSREHTTEGEPAPVEGHPCTVADTPGVTHASPDADDPPGRPGRAFDPEIVDDVRDQLEHGSIRWTGENPANSSNTPPSRTRKRKTSAPKPGQVALDISDPPEADAVAELLAEHERLRRAAQRAHGLRVTALPSPSSGDGHSLRLRLRKAVTAHGPEVCRRALEYRGREWAEDPGALARWSTDSMWSPKSLAASIPASAGQAHARASPSRRDAAPLSCEPSGLQMPRIVIDPNAKCL
jgi:hypothetical protein